MRSFKKATMLCILISACQIQTAAHASKIVKRLGAVIGVGCLAALCKDEYDRQQHPREYAITLLKKGKCTLSFISDLMVCDEDPVLVRDKEAKDVDARFVYDDFSHYHRIDDTLKQRPVKNLVLCAASSDIAVFRQCVTLDCIKTREELEELLGESGMQFDMKAKTFPYELASWQTRLAPEEALATSRLQKSKEQQ